jgi:predicted ester cyclase
MSIEKNKAVALRFEEEFKNKANVDVVFDVMAPDFTHHLPFPGLPAGRDGMKAVGQSVFASFAHENLKIVVEQCFGDGEFVATRVRVRARHTGDFNGIPATGKEVGWTENNLFRIRDGKIIEMWGEGNFLGLMAQLGAAPAGERKGAMAPA